MITTPFEKGMVFLCNDNFPMVGTLPMKHNYIIIGGCPQGPIGMVQCMSITSMTNKDVTIEVPIKLCNDYVSYIVPYNLHSMKVSDIELHNFKGCITDTPRISKDDFLSMLRDLYLDHIGLGTRDHTAVIADYNLYCKKFWEEFKNVPEFRDRKITAPITVAPVQAQTSVPTDEEVNQILSSVVRNTQHNISTASEEKTTPCNTSTSSYRNTSKKKKKGRKARRQQKREHRLMERAMHEAVGYSSNDITDSNAVTQDDPVYALSLTLEMAAELVNVPRMTKDWSDEQLIMFVQAFDKSGSAKIHSVIPNRWTSYSAMKYTKLSAEKELEARKIPENVTKDPLKRPLSQWTDKELAMFVSLMDAHKYDTEFKLKYTGFNEINQCHQLTYRIRKELKERNTSVSAS